PMAKGPIREALSKFARSGQVILSRIVRVCGVGEGVVEDKIRHLLASKSPTVAPYAQVAEVHLRVTAAAPTAGEEDALIAPMVDRIRDALGDSVYGTDDTSLEQATLDLMKEKDLTLAVAESISGGMLGARLTSVAGSGDVFLGGVISYDSGKKADILRVDK